MKLGSLFLTGSDDCKASYCMDGGREYYRQSYRLTLSSSIVLSVSFVLVCNFQR
jgi:hypothetical protein